MFGALKQTVAFVFFKIKGPETCVSDKAYILECGDNLGQIEMREKAGR